LDWSGKFGKELDESDSGDDVLGGEKIGTLKKGLEEGGEMHGIRFHGRGACVGLRRIVLIRRKGGEKTIITRKKQSRPKGE